MVDYVLWFGLGLLLVVAELLVGTYYLLMIAVGLAAGGLAALGGGPFPVQVVAASAVALVAVLLLRRTRLARAARATATESNPDVLLDIGQTVDVFAWTDGQARVRYRGSDWDAIPESPAMAAVGALSIKAIRGSTLVLGPAARVPAEETR